MRDKNNSLIKTGNALCRLAEAFAPQVSKKCMGMYYQPSKPENMVDFVSLCEKKRK